MTGPTLAQGQPLRLTLKCVDRYGTQQPDQLVSGETGPSGVFQADFQGLPLQGKGLVTAEVLGVDPAITTSASFLLFDVKAPTVAIQATPVGPGLPTEVRVSFSDEIGISSVTLQATGALDGTFSRVLAAGTKQGSLTFSFDIPLTVSNGDTLTLYALATDLSGNMTTAVPVTVPVDSSLSIWAPASFTPSKLTEGSASFLDRPRAIAFSPKNQLLYFADNSLGSPCSGACIREVNPATGLPTAWLFVGTGRLEGLAFDATGDSLYYTDRQNRVGRLTWDGAAYSGAVMCNVPANQNPQEPRHLIVDPTLGVMLVDQSNQNLKRLTACVGNDPVNHSAVGGLKNPRGLSIAATGELLVSDEVSGEILSVDRNTGAVTQWETAGTSAPAGIEWLGTSTSPFANSLFVASHGNGRILSTKGGSTTRTAVRLRNAPVDIAFGSGTYAGRMWILTEPSVGNPGRVYAVGGY